MGIIDFLRNAIETWNEKLAEIWILLTQSPQEFKGGGIWRVIENVHSGLVAIGLALLVLFFVIGMTKTCISYSEVKRPEQAVKLFLRFIIARTIVVYGMEVMIKVFEIVQGIMMSVISAVGLGSVNDTTLPQEIIEAVEDVGFLEGIPLWFVSLLGSVFITILSFVIILTVYGRFFKLYLYTAISPIPLSASASESTQSITISFLKSYTGVCLEGVIILLSCIIFTAYSGSQPVVEAGASAASMLWTYIGELIFNMLVLVGIVIASDRTVKEMMGL